MQQLSGQDASFIYSERPHAPTHVTTIGIYDQSTAPGGAVTFKGILAHLEARLHLARAFRQKVVRVPCDLDHPWWVEDGEFDLEYHVRHIALPKPGDWRQFCIQAARLHARPLDLSKPLWELYVIEGLDNVEGIPKGAFAFVLKVHHAAIDGKSGVEMLTAIHTQSPDVGTRPRRRRRGGPSATRRRSSCSTRASVNAWRTPVRAAASPAASCPGSAGRSSDVRRSDGAASTGLAPGTRFNGPVTGHRVLDAGRSRFADLKPIREPSPGPPSTTSPSPCSAARCARTSLPRRAPRFVAAGDDAGVGAHRGRAGATWATRSRRCSSPSPRTSPIPSSASPPCSAPRSLQGGDPGDRRPQPHRALPARARRADRRRDATRRRSSPDVTVPPSSTPSSPTCPDRASRCTSPAPRRDVVRRRPVVDGMGLINIVTSYESSSCSASPPAGR